MSDENGTATEEKEEVTPSLQMTDADHEKIADNLFKKQEEKKDKEKKEKERKEQGLPEVKLTDEDHKGIATHLHEMMQTDAPTPEPEKKEKKEKTPTPEPHKNLFDRPLFGFGGKK